MFVFSKMTWFVLASVLLVCALGGCGGGNNSIEAYTPSDAVARKALETALNAWQAGQPLALIKSTAEGDPDVQPVDNEWNGGKKLTKFEIVGQGSSSTTGPREFKVKLTLERDATPRDTTYYVVGLNPISVFRDTDYAERASSM